MPRLRDWMDRRFYPGFAKNWDDTMFRERILARMRPEHRCLDYGAGRGNVTQMDFRGHASFLAGVDVDEAVLQNPFVHEAAVIALPEGRIPFPDESFDIVYSDNVMEHVADPAAALTEIQRVLRPGGILLAKTPNRWHYVAILARLTPTWFHRFYNSRRGRKEHDTFPTLYRCNSRRQVARLSRAVGFEVSATETWEGRPEYLRLWAPLYVLGLLYERIVNAAGWLTGLRCVLYFELRKPV